MGESVLGHPPPCFVLCTGRSAPVLVLLLLLILVLLVVIYKFYKIRPLAAYLLLPYLLWCFFAAYLTCSIASMNA